jgi:ABC-2 type transport system permease protein
VRARRKARGWVGLQRILAIARKEVMHIRRDLATLYFALGMPLVLLALFGYAVTFDLDHIKVVVADEDRSAESRALAAHLFAGDTFVRAGDVPSGDDAEVWFRRGQAGVALVIPHGYGEHVARGEPVDVQILLDAADNQTAASVLSYTARFGAAENGRLVRERVGVQAPRIEARVRALYNPALRSALFLVPGLIAMIQSMMGVILTALTVAREWERGSMEQLFSTPVSRLHIVVGKLLPYFVVAMIQLLIVLTGAVWLFDVPIRGSAFLLAGISALFLLAMLGQGLFVSVVTKNQMVATQAAAMTSMLPSMLLSGFVLPIENMPRVIQWITWVVPARYFVDASRALLLRGAGFEAVRGDMLALAIFSTVLIAACMARFQRKIA